MKICMECRHSSVKPYSYSGEVRCMAPGNDGGLCLITGTMIPKYGHVYQVRRSPEACGEEGKWFEPKKPETFWSWLFS